MTSLEAPTYPGTLARISSSAAVSSAMSVISKDLPTTASISALTPTTTSLSGAITPISSRPKDLSTLDLPGVAGSQSVVEATNAPAPWPSLLSPPELSSSVEGALTSGGVPALVVESLLPVIIGTAAMPSASASAVLSQQEEQAAIDAFIKWLLSFFQVQ